ncbi:MAG: hypothetical protein KJZ85_06560 [Rhodobacteraceae bacterium]|jgi:hypothetical protein|nr:hypothetical protein [Paracoccaceae bacterium]
MKLRPIAVAALCLALSAAPAPAGGPVVVVPPAEAATAPSLPPEAGLLIIIFALVAVALGMDNGDRQGGAPSGR